MRRAQQEEESVVARNTDGSIQLRLDQVRKAKVDQVRLDQLRLDQVRKVKVDQVRN